MIPTTNPPNRLDQLRANAGPMPPVGGAPMSPPLPARRPPMPPAGSAALPPPASLPTGGSAPPIKDPEEDRLDALLGGMEEDAPMMPEEAMEEDTSTVASAIASAALANSGTPEEALKALIEAADQIRETLT